MFCMKCGRPTEGEQVLCNECAAAQEQAEEVTQSTPEMTAEEIPAPTPEVIAVPVLDETPVEISEEEAAAEPEVPADGAEIPNFTVDEEPKAPAKKRIKSKKAVIAWAVTAAVAVSSLVSVIIFWDIISWWFCTLFCSPSYQNEVAESRTAGEGSVVDLFGTVYDNIIETAKKPAGSTQAGVSLEIGEDYIKLLETAIEAETGESVDLSWFNNVGLELKSATVGNDSGLDIAVKLNGTAVVTLRVYMDMDDGMLHVGIPELNNQFLCFDIGELAEVDFTQYMELVEKNSGAINRLLNNLPEGEDLEDLLQDYIAVAAGAMKNVNKSKKTLTVNGISQNFTVLTVKISEATGRDILVAILEEAAEDEDLEELLDVFLNFAKEVAGSELNMSGMGGMLNAKSLLQNLDLAAHQLKQEQVSNETLAILTNYVDSSGRIRARALADAEGNEFVRYAKVADGDKWAYELVVRDALTIRGSGTEKDDKISGTLTLEAVSTGYTEGPDGWTTEQKTIQVATIGLSNVDKEKLFEEGELVGTFTFAPGKDLLDQVLNSANDTPAAVSGMAGIISSVKLELTLTERGSTLRLKTGDKLVFGLGTTLTNGAAYTPAKPESSVSADSETAVMNWMKNLNPAKIFENLKTAKVPEALTKWLEEGWNELKKELEEGSYGPSVVPNYGYN